MAEQVTAAFYEKLKGLLSTAFNVDRGEAYPTENLERSLSINMGSDTPIDEQTLTYIDSWLEIVIDIRAKSNEQLDMLLSRSRAEITVALGMNDQPPLGLSACKDIEEGPAGPPVIESGAEKPTGRQTVRYSVLYRRSRTDPTKL